MLDLVGQIVKHTNSKAEWVENLRRIVKHSLKHSEFPYDWNAGEYVYITALSAIFIGTIIMEVCKRLNTHAGMSLRPLFINFFLAPGCEHKSYVQSSP